MSRAMYAFSGDPITYGHIDIIKRASKLFDELIVGVGVNPDHQYTFTLKERYDMAVRSISKFENVRAVELKGMLVDFAYENNVDVIIRGIRGFEDFEHEKFFYQAGESQKLGIETCAFFAKQDMAHISSSMVKILQKEQGLIHEYVPLYVKKCLEEKMSGQFIVGVTGEIGSGKSYISDMMKQMGEKHGLEVHHIDLDQIGHKIIGELKEERYKKIKQRIIDTCGEEIFKSDGGVNKRILGYLVFKDQDKLDVINQILYTPIMSRLRRELHGKKGMIFINSTLLAETAMNYVCNNNIILININKEEQEIRLKQRGFVEEQIKHRVACQYDSEKKSDMIKEIIKEDGYGHLWELDNSKEVEMKEIEKLFVSVKDYFGIELWKTKD